MDKDTEKVNFEFIPAPTGEIIVTKIIKSTKTEHNYVGSTNVGQYDQRLLNEKP